MLTDGLILSMGGPGEEKRRRRLSLGNRAGARACAREAVETARPSALSRTRERGDSLLPLALARR